MKALTEQQKRHLQYRWTAATELIHAINDMHVLAYVNRATDLDRFRLRQCEREWDVVNATHEALQRFPHAAYDWANHNDNADDYVGVP